MLTFEKVLKVFQAYLDDDPLYEVVQTSHGYTLMAWEPHRNDWYSAETQDPKYSRMTVTVTGDDDVLEQIQKQLTKLVDVKEIMELPQDASVCRELVLVKVECDAAHRQEIIAISDVFRAKIVDVSPESVIIELTGVQNKLNAFIELLNGFKITELARTGITGLARGAANLK